MHTLYTQLSVPLFLVFFLYGIWDLLGSHLCWGLLNLWFRSQNHSSELRVFIFFFLFGFETIVVHHKWYQNNKSMKNVFSWGSLKLGLITIHKCMLVQLRFIDFAMGVLFSFVQFWNISVGESYLKYEMGFLFFFCSVLYYF